jgi:membrane-bound serine protease (ClpP class)
VPPFLLILLAFCARVLAGTVPVLTLEGSVDPGSADYLVTGIHQAEADGAPAVVILIDTPGGLLESARDVVQAELAAGIPVIAFVSPSGARAGSAGVFITLAANLAVMAPGTTMGAAHPVSLFGGLGGGEGEKGGSGEAMSQKILNDTAAWARAIAEQRGRDPAFAEAAVTESRSITNREAIEKGIIDLVAGDLDELLLTVDGRSVTTAAGEVTLSTDGATPLPVPMSLRQRLVHFLGDPNVLFVLIALGALGLYFEFRSPGMVVPGVVGGIAVLVAAVGLSLVAFNLGGLLLVIFGFVLFALEIWVPSHGALSVGGAIALLLGGMLLFNVGNMDLRVDLSILVAVPLVVMAFSLLAGWLVLRSHRTRPQTGTEGLPGAIGVVSQGGTGGGWVLVFGESWRARWTGYLENGSEVRVIEVERLSLLVEPAGKGS